jgi:hypothetical protein
MLHLSAAHWAKHAFSDFTVIGSPFGIAFQSCTSVMSSADTRLASAANTSTNLKTMAIAFAFEAAGITDYRRS